VGLFDVFPSPNPNNEVLTEEGHVTDRPREEEGEEKEREGKGKQKINRERLAPPFFFFSLSL
jgi:hypothetical protein